MKENVKNVIELGKSTEQKNKLKRGHFPKAETQISLEKVWLQPAGWW